MRSCILPVRVLSRLFRRRCLEELQNAHRDNQLSFCGEHAELADPTTFAEWLAPLRQCEWVVYAKRPFAGPQAVLAYLSRYTHRVAISNSRLIACDERGVTFRWKDCRTHGSHIAKARELLWQAPLAWAGIRQPLTRPVIQLRTATSSKADVRRREKGLRTLHGGRFAFRMLHVPKPRATGRAAVNA